MIQGALLYMSTELNVRSIDENAGVVVLESEPAVLIARKRIGFFSKFQFKAKRGK
jgi:hypothetical protein